MKPNTRRLATIATTILLAAGTANIAQAQWAPSKTVRLVVPFPPGGAADILARLVANQITQASGQGMVVENRPGGGTVIATEAVSRATPDGTTLLLMANSFVINASLRTHLSYDPLTSFEHICFMAQSPHVLSVNSKSTIKTFADLAAQAKAKPGELTIAAVGPATTHHIAIEVLKRSANLDMTYVSFTGGAPSVTNLIGGHVTSALTNYAEAKENLGGTLRPIAVGTRERLPELPDIPTLNELGYPDVIGVSWFGLVAPATTPAAAIAEITKRAKAALADTEVSTKVAGAGIVAEGKTCGADFTALLKTQHGRYAKAIKEAGIKEK